VLETERLRAGLNGHFWPTRSASEKVPGKFTIDVEGRNRVELFSATTDMFEWRRDELRVLGELENGKSITLDGCFLTSHQFASKGYSKGTLHANTAFIGQHFPDGAEIVFRGIRFHSAAIDHWFGMGGLETKFDDEKRLTINISESEAKTWALPRDIEVTAQCFWSGAPFFPAREARLSAATHISLLAKKELSVSELSKLQHAFTCFIAIATGQPIPAEDINLYTPEAKEGVLFNAAPLNRTPPDLSSLLPPFGIFGYETIHDRFGSMLARWFENYDTFQIPIDLYLGTKTGRDFYLANKFTMLMQALEALHRRLSTEQRMSEQAYNVLCEALHKAAPNHREWLDGVLAFGNEPSLRRRLKSLLKGMKSIFLPDVNVSALINDMVNARNYFAHYSNGGATSIPKEGAFLYELSAAAEMLLHVHFLALMDLSREDAAAAYGKSQVWSHNHRRLGKRWG
jgi:hypothetical protein